MGHHGLVQSSSNGRVSKASDVIRLMDVGGGYVVVRVDEMEAEVWIWGLGARHEIVEALGMGDP